MRSGARWMTPFSSRAATASELSRLRRIRNGSSGPMASTASCCAAGSRIFFSHDGSKPSFGRGGSESSSSSWLAGLRPPASHFVLVHGGPLKRPVAGSWVRSRPRQRGWASTRLASSGVISRLIGMVLIRPVATALRMVRAATPSASAIWSTRYPIVGGGRSRDGKLGRSLSRAAIRFMALVSPEARCLALPSRRINLGKGPQVGPKGKPLGVRICGEWPDSSHHPAPAETRISGRGGTRLDALGRREGGPSAAAPARKLAVISESPSCLERKIRAIWAVPVRGIAPTPAGLTTDAGRPRGVPTPAPCTPGWAMVLFQGTAQHRRLGKIALAAGVKGGRPGRPQLFQLFPHYPKITHLNSFRPRPAASAAGHHRTVEPIKRRPSSSILFQNRHCRAAAFGQSPRTRLARLRSGPSNPLGGKCRIVRSSRPPSEFA